MRRVALVRRRDGEVVPFDEGSIVDAVHRALLAAGREDRLLAGEIASVVTLFLEKTYYDEVPSVAQVEDMVEKVLLETGHASAAKAFILHRERETRLRDVRAVRAEAPEPTLFETGAITVDDPVRGISLPFSREGVARLLAADGTVSRPEADAAEPAATEQRLRRLGVTRVSASWVRAVAEVELLDRGAGVDLRRRPGVLLDAETIGASYGGRGPADAPPLPASAARALGSAALRAHALADLLPLSVAQAHLQGEIHVHGLDLPGALHAVAFTPADVRRGAAPGSGTRSAEDAGDSARRLSAAIGRAARIIGSAASSTAVLGVSEAYATLREGGVDREALQEEAWHLLYETSIDGTDAASARVELDLTPECTDRGSEIASHFTCAVLRVLGRGSGLPPKDTLPVPVVPVSESILGRECSRDALRLAAEAVLRGDRVLFPLVRSGALRGTSRARAALIAGGPSDGSTSCPGRVTLNLARAASAVGRGQIERFLRECDRLVELAATAHRARREFLAQVAAAPGGTLAPLFRGARGKGGLLSLGAGTWSIGVTGLNEALVHLTGFELHEGEDAALRAAQRIVSYLALHAREATFAVDLPCVLDADEDADVARRLFALDLRNDPARTVAVLPGPGYTPGVGCRADAPVDALLRLEREEPLHHHLATATVRIPLPVRDAGGPDGVVALLGKCLRGGRAVQAEVVAW